MGWDPEGKAVLPARSQSPLLPGLDRVASEAWTRWGTEEGVPLHIHCPDGYFERSYQVTSQPSAFEGEQPKSLEGLIVGHPLEALDHSDGKTLDFLKKSDVLPQKWGGSLHSELEMRADKCCVQRHEGRRRRLAKGATDEE